MHCLVLFTLKFLLKFLVYPFPQEEWDQEGGDRRDLGLGKLHGKKKRKSSDNVTRGGWGYPLSLGLKDKKG